MMIYVQKIEKTDGMHTRALALDSAEPRDGPVS